MEMGTRTKTGSWYTSPPEGEAGPNMRITMLAVLCFMVAFICSGPMTPAAPSSGDGQIITLAETPQGRIVAEFLEVFSAGDEEALTRFVNRHWSRANLERLTPEQRRLALRTVYRDTHGFEPRRVTEATDTRVTVLCQARLDRRWLELGFEFEPNPPHGVAGLRITRIDAPADVQPTPRIGEAEFANALRTYVDGVVETEGFSGAVLVARGKKPLFTSVSGQASRRYGVANRLDTRFNLGSCNKMFTAVAIAQLVEQGRLAFGDAIIKHLPDYPNADAARKVTLHHLLTHTSGLGDYFPALFASRWPEVRTIEQFLALAANEPLEFEPGARTRYSNFGFIVLGRIIEQVSGETYYDYVNKHVFAPAGMDSTDSYEVDDPVPNLATGYTRMRPGGRQGPAGAGLRENYFVHSVKGSSAGGGYSTVEDLLRFAMALRAEELLSKAMLETVTAGRVETGPGTMYGYGFEVTGEGRMRAIGHNGGAPGINAFFRTYPEAGFTVCVLSNDDPPVADRVGAEIEELLDLLE